MCGHTLKLHHDYRMDHIEQGLIQGGGRGGNPPPLKPLCNFSEVINLLINHKIYHMHHHITLTT